MAEIDVKALDANNLRVSIDAATKAEDVVHVTADYGNKLCNGRVTTRELVKKSFAFCWEKNPILASYVSLI